MLGRLERIEEGLETDFIKMFDLKRNRYMDLSGIRTRPTREKLKVSLIKESK